MIGPFPFTGPWIEMLCWIGDWFGMSIVTGPGLAVALPNRKASAPDGSAGIVSLPPFSAAVLLWFWLPPTDASRPVSCPGLPATDPTYAATSCRSSPVTRFAGMMLPRRGLRIWSRTTPSITVSPKPFWRAFSNAASRFGPWFPLVPACCRAWQLPQVALPMKSLLPFTRSGWLRPQPASATAARATTAAAHRDVLWRLRPKARRRLSARAARRLVRRRTRELLEPALRGGDHAARHPLPAEAPPGLFRERGPGPVALLGRHREPLRELRGD